MNKIKIKLFLITLVILAAVIPASSQITSSQVDQLVEKAIKEFNVAGTAVGIVKDGKIIHLKGYGVKSVETKEKVDENTDFAIASNTKAFTAAALSILVDEGKISWQDKVVDHIPEFTMYNDYVTQNFTIEDLLTHRSGLGLGAGDLMFFPDGSDFTMKDILTNFKHFKPQSGFRTKFDYDNVLYLVAGEVIKRVSGKPWDVFVTERILKPIGMKHTYALLGDMKDRSNLAEPHSTETGTIRVVPHYEFDSSKMNGAAGSIYSNVADLSRWMLVQLNKGKYGDKLEKQLFSEARQREMWKIHTVTDVGRNPRYNSHFAGYGFGWGLTDMKGNMVVTHTGGLPGMLSKTLLIPDLNLGVVVLTNTEAGGSGLFAAVTNTIADSYLGLEDFDWIKAYSDALGARTARDEVSEKVWETVKNAKSDHIKPEDYIGIYEDNWFGKCEVFMKNNKLWFKSYRSPQLNGQMQFYKANTFAIKWEYQAMNADAFAIFSLDEDGKAERIRLKGISPNIDFSFDFQDLDFKRVK
ncbi:MAG: serine hydrolase [Acidobacteria bacterium]|nr:serine hydrolase [Acidobacteriota bacterium]